MAPPLRDCHECPSKSGDRQELPHNDPEEPQCRQPGTGQLPGSGPSDRLKILRCKLPRDGKDLHQPKTTKEICRKYHRKPQAPKRKMAKFEMQADEPFHKQKFGLVIQEFIDPCGGVSCGETTSQHGKITQLGRAQLSAAACQSYLTLTRSSLTTVIIFDQAGGSVSGLVEN